MKNDPNKRTDHIGKNRRVTFEYPANFTNQQRGFTPAGSPGLNFPSFAKTGNKTPTSRIPDWKEKTIISLWSSKDSNGKNKNQNQKDADNTQAYCLVKTLAKAIKSIYIN